ncbi:MAG TPA: hypothetical protein VFU28_16185 [Vicinamibacterales bacterium]|nr:hypothetical protein [Vicinamibacterales bacterium]
MIFALAAVYTLAWQMTPIADPSEEHPSTGATDMSLFRDVVGGIRAGGTYYDVMGSALRTHNYPVRSIFNWRQPWLLQGLARIPDWCGRLTLVLLAGLMIVKATGILRREMVGALFVINAALPAAAAQSVFFAEIWAGFLIALSVVAYAKDKRTEGVLWGLAALFVRELAAPYCILATLIAIRERRWREVVAWSAGLAVYGVLIAVHAWRVLQHIRPDDPAIAHSWVYFGGLPFLFQVWRTDGLFMLLPRPAFAFVVVAIIASWWSSRIPLHARGTVAIYSICFLIVGLPFNTYWGFVVAPVMGIWLSYAYDGVHQLFSGPSSTREIADPRVAGAAV